MNILLTPGDRALITCDNWFIAPDGKTYRAVFGTVRAVRSSEESLGIKTNARSTNWYVEIGNMLLAGCQVHYAIKADSVNTGESTAWSSHEGRTVVDKTPSQIYNADGNSGVNADVPPAEPAHPLREEYDSMAPHQRAHFGSFEAYCAMHAQLEEPIEESGDLLPEYVWLTRDQISDAQERGAISRDNGRYAIRVEDLTPEQKAVKP